MVVRRRKKKNKLRGHRSHGKGDTKNKRGAGCRGGRGKAGSHKHKFSKYYTHFGVKVKLKPKKKGKSINLEVLSRLLPKWKNLKLVEMREGYFVVDGTKISYQKILSMGEIKERLLIKNMAVSKKAEEKIVAAGGRVHISKHESLPKEKKELEAGAKGEE